MSNTARCPRCRRQRKEGGASHDCPCHFTYRDSAFLFEEEIDPAQLGEELEAAELAAAAAAAKNDPKAKGKPAGKKDADDEEDDAVPPSIFAKSMQQVTKEYTEQWESQQTDSVFETKLDQVLMKNMLRPGVLEDIRKNDVDTVMYVELENLRLRYESKKGKKGKDKKKGKGKGKKGKDKGKGKKRKDPTESRPLDSIFGELIAAKILVKVQLSLLGGHSLTRPG